MTAASSAPVQHDRYWLVPLTRAIIALVVAAVITFTAAHTPVIGMISFGVFALISGVATGAGSFLVGDRVARRLTLAQGVFSVVAGIVALALNGAGLGVFLYTVSVWAALTGFCELYCGLRVRGHVAAARDWLTVGVLTAVLALVFLLIPADALLAVGLFGAYAVVIGVFLAIGAFTLKWGVSHSAAAAEAGGASGPGAPGSVGPDARP